jgi:hypothetical protein
MRNRRKAVYRIRTTENRLWSTGMDDHSNYRDVTHRVMTALAMTEAAFVRARRTSAGRRLKLLPVAVEALKKHRLRQNEERLLCFSL